MIVLLRCAHQAALPVAGRWSVACPVAVRRASSSACLHLSRSATMCNRRCALGMWSGSPGLTGSQNSYSLLARQDEPELLPLCAERGLAYFAFSPLAGGWLTGMYRRGVPYPAGSRMTQRPEPYREFVSRPTFDALEELQVIAARRGTSLAGLALGWLLADERVTQVVIGPDRPKHLAPVAEALRHPVTGEERTEIEAAVARRHRGDVP